MGWGITKNLLYIQEFNQIYSEEDISLAKEVAKYIPNLKDALKSYQPFFIDTLLFIPDEYKV